MNILIIEDDPSTLRMLEYMCKQEYPSATVWTCDLPNDNYLQRILEEKIDLILLDLILPIYSGTEILVTLRRAKETRHIPIIVMSAKTLEKDIVNHLDFGADEYITKPFSPAEVRARIRSVVKRQKILV